MDFSRKGLRALLEMTPILFLNSCAFDKESVSSAQRLKMLLSGGLV